MVIKVSGQDEDGSADRTLHWWVAADRRLADVAGVVRPHSLEVA